MDEKGTKPDGVENNCKWQIFVIVGVNFRIMLYQQTIFYKLHEKYFKYLNYKMI